MIEQYNTLAEKFLKKGFWLYLFSFIIGPIGYIIKILISSDLTVAEVGILYGIISLVTLLSAYNDLGMTESLKHFIPEFVTQKRFDRVKSILFYALFVQIFSSLLIAGFFYFGADYIANNYFKTQEAVHTLKTFAFFFIGINIFQTLNNFFMAIQDTFSHKITETIRMLFIMLFVVFIFFGDLGSLSNYSYSWLIGLYIGVIITIIVFLKKYYKKYFKKQKIIIEKDLILKVSKYAIFVFIGASAGTILGQIDMQMIIYLLGTTQAGYYTNYLSIIGIPFILIGPILGFLFPVFSEMYSKGEYKKIKLVKEIFTRNFILIGIMFNIFFFVFAKIITFILFGEKFIISGLILRYSVLFLVFNFLLQINFNILAGIGQVGKRVKIIIVAVVFNFVTNIIFINLLGVYGAALATGCGWILIYILSEYYLGKDYKITYNFKIILKNIFVLGVSGFFIYNYGLVFIEGFSRLNSLFIIGFIFILWSLIFIGINYGTFKSFIGEVKRLIK